MDDSIIVQRLLEREEAVLSEVSEKYGKYCKTIARNIVGNDQSAEEIVQDTLMRVWESIPPNRPQRLQPYIGKITRNLSLDAVKSMNTQKRGGKELETVIDELSDLSESKSDVENLAEQREMLSAINEFLGSLKEDKRKILVLRYWHCFSVADISQIVGISAVNVSSTLKRERKKLMEYLKKRGY